MASNEDSHMACEVAVERALTKDFASKGVGYLEDAVAWSCLRRSDQPKG